MKQKLLNEICTYKCQWLLSITNYFLVIILAYLQIFILQLAKRKLLFICIRQIAKSLNDYRLLFVIMRYTSKQLFLITLKILYLIFLVLCKYKTQQLPGKKYVLYSETWIKMYFESCKHTAFVSLQAHHNKDKNLTSPMGFPSWKSIFTFESRNNFSIFTLSQHTASITTDYLG